MNDRVTDNGACLHCGGYELPVEGLQRYRGVDPCLGCLPDVTQACCGHGGLAIPYCIIAPGNVPGTMRSDEAPGTKHVRLSGAEALEFFRAHGAGPA